MAKNALTVAMRAIGVLTIAAVALASCRGLERRTETTAASPSAAMLSDTSNGQDWPAYGRTYGEQHFSPLVQINSDNVKRLGLAWALDLPTGNSVTQPLEVEGTLFFTTGNSIVHAVDASTGRALWVHDTHASEVAGERMRMSWGSRGLGYWNGKIYTGTVDGRLIALDAKTGIQVWSVQTLPVGSLGFISGAPRLFDGKVIIGQGGADSSDLRGYVTTYNAETGQQLWRFFTVPGNPALGFEDDAQKMAASTWFGEWWKYGGGGNDWNAFSYDAETRTIFLGTGNGAPWNRRIRSEGKGDNLFLCSIVALDADTGKYKWHYQVNPGESWDYNASMDMHLMDLNIDGVLRKVLVTAPKNGFLYVIDRQTGKLISATKYVQTTWAERIDLESGRPVETPEARYPDGKTVEIWPGPNGAHTSLPSAVSPQTGLFYVSAMNAGATFSDAGISPKGWERAPHNVFDPGTAISFDVEAKASVGSALVAIDPVTQKLKWSVPTPGRWNGAVMATRGNLVFEGQGGGTFDAYDATTGHRLWSFAAQAGVLAPPISYAINGRQYVTVLTGIGLTAALTADGLAGTHDYRTQTRRVLTFALDGTATIPPSTPFVAIAPSDPDFRQDPAAGQRGMVVYYGHCSQCHGIGGVAAGVAPDLRTSTVPQSAQAMDIIVRQGALVSQGMPQFGELSDQAIADLRAFLRGLSSDLRARALNH
jgi:quinohemoprotein ethanol dehydrogenase